MSVNMQFERLYDRIELVRGLGSRPIGKLCIMSFVAYLAGERHTDHPRVASSFIRNFAIRLNDGTTSSLRQELKPFAPRIIVTNDGRDVERAAVVFQTIVDDVLPRIAVDFPDAQHDEQTKKRTGSPFTFDAWWGGSGSPYSVTSSIRNIHAAQDSGDCLLVGTWAGHLLATLTCDAPTSTARRWYWAKALELLDRLCDVGAEHRAMRVGFEGGSAQPTPFDHRSHSPVPSSGLPQEAVTGKRMIPRWYRAMRDLMSASVS